MSNGAASRRKHAMIRLRCRRIFGAADQPVRQKTSVKGKVVSALYSNNAVSDRNLHPSVGRLHFYRSPQQYR